MANKGPRRREKRLAASRIVPLLRKEYVWHIRAKPGPHKRRNSVALGFVLRDLVGITQNARETKAVLNQGIVLVDGKAEKDSRRPVGLFDLVSVLNEKKTFRVLFNRKGELALAEERFGCNEKICKVVGKKVVSNGITQLATNDGRCFREKKADADVGDSLLVQVPEQKILKVLKETAEKMVFVTDGKHIGSTAKIKGMDEGTMGRPKLVTLQTPDGEFKTVERNIIVVGEEKPLVKVE